MPAVPGTANLARNQGYAELDASSAPNGQTKTLVPMVVQVNAAGTALGGSATDGSMTVVANMGPGTDRSGSITTGGTAQTVAVANTARKALTLQNTSAGDLRVTEVTALTPSATVGYQVPAGQSFKTNTTDTIKVWGATTGQTFIGTEV